MIFRPNTKYSAESIKQTDLSLTRCPYLIFDFKYMSSIRIIVTTTAGDEVGKVTNPSVL